MPWEWEVLLAVVRLLFLSAPFMKVESDFAITGGPLHEAKEYAQAANCRAMLVSFPAELFISVLAQASSAPCKTINLLMVVIYAVAACVVAFGLFKIPARWFRGTVPPYIWFAIFTATSIIAKSFGLTPAVALICQR